MLLLPLSYAENSPSNLGADSSQPARLVIGADNMTRVKLEFCGGPKKQSLLYQ